jgi:hypothetical protein
VELHAAFLVRCARGFQIKSRKRSFGGTLLRKNPKRLAGDGVIPGFKPVTVSKHQNGCGNLSRRYLLYSRLWRWPVALITFFAQAIDLFSEAVHFSC